ncbi:hypothetical protein Cni_G26552 [Canna indica]|uniref:Uncharacterized protein n=1 Tax=Canna indica TaxID=4628 RepID=A0AAQ3QNH4_9LILI|nr:hypothetical protein Cni_G26552 [Canna indica]
MRIGVKLSLAFVLGAGFELKKQMMVARPSNSSSSSAALKSSLLAATGSSAAAQVRVLQPRSKQYSLDSTVASEEALRMLFYLSCWGPN